MPPRNIHQRPGRPVTPRREPVRQSKPFDVDALECDGVQEPFRATIGGEEWTFKDVRAEDWQDNDHIRSSQDGKLALHLALGDEQWARFLELPKGTVSDRKLEKLAEAVAEYYGQGEDDA